MSYEEPVVISTSFLVVSSLRSFMGLGVVVTTHLGLEPSLSPNARLSQVNLGYCHEASSSHQAASNCGPLSWSGS